MTKETTPLHKTSVESDQDRTSDQVLDLLKRDWQTQSVKPLEHYARMQPVLECNDEFLLDLVYTDVLCRQRAGVTIDRMAYVDCFPHLAQAIDRQLLVHQELIAEVPDSPTSSTGSRETIGVTLGHGLSTHSDPMKAVNPQQPPDLPGYRLGMELGRGGMGVVYKAEQTQLKRTVAIKMLRPHNRAEREALERLRSEASSIARLQHPNIVQIFDCTEYQGMPVLVLEFVDGQTLCSWAQSQRPVTTVVRLMEIVARTIDYAHRQGIVHRDLKPANILLAQHAHIDAKSNDNSSTDDGSMNSINTLNTANAMSSVNSVNSANSVNAVFDPITECWRQPKIADFGLAKQIQSEDQQLTRTEAILGTATYLSPEQAWGRSREVGPASDVHALGVILYELLTGNSPFHGDTLMHTLDSVRFIKPESITKINREVSNELDAICMRCLEKQAQDRFQSAGELADHLASYLQGDTRPLTSNRPKSSKTERQWKRWPLIGLGTFTIIALLFSLIWSGDGKGGQGARERVEESSKGVPGTLAGGEKITAKTAPRTTPTKRAFLVGVRAYWFPSGSFQLKFTEADVDEMARVLNRHGFPREHIQLMTQWSQVDNPKLAPSADNLRRQLRQFLDECIEGDEVIIMLTGMGGETGKQNGYFYLPSDANLNEARSLLSLGELLSYLEICPAKQKLLLIDTCQSVTLPQLDFPSRDMPRDVGVLLACSASEASYEDDQLRHGVFSYYVMRGLEGEADADRDHTIQLRELLDYTRQYVQELVSTKHPGFKQTPTLLGSLPKDAPILQLDSR